MQPRTKHDRTTRTDGHTIQAPSAQPVAQGSLAAGRATKVYRNGQPGARKVARRIVDLLFCLDATSSMGPYIAAMIANMLNLLRLLVESGLDVQFGLVVFYDEGYGQFPQLYPMGATAEEIQRILKRTEVCGGGDEPESALPAIVKGLSLPGFRQDATKVLLFVSDAPCHDPEGGISSSDVLARLKAENVLTFCCAPNVAPYREFASATRGELFPIRPDMPPNSFDGILRALVNATKVTVKLRHDASVLAEVRETARKTHIFGR